MCCCAGTLLQYKALAARYAADPQGAAYQQALAELHEHAASKLLLTIQANGGLYIKAGRLPGASAWLCPAARCQAVSTFNTNQHQMQAASAPSITRFPVCRHKPPSSPCLLSAHAGGAAGGIPQRCPAAVPQVSSTEGQAAPFLPQMA